MMSLASTSHELGYDNGMDRTTTRADKDTAFFTAARNGIDEIVVELLSKIPSVIYETNSANQNVLHVAVKNRQLNVIQKLRKELVKEAFESLILELDDGGNTVLHLAAVTTNNERTWQIADSAMQMMFDIKWYEYIRELVAEDLDFRRNYADKSAWEVFEEKHEKKVKECSERLKDLSNSGSVVAALIAGATFGTSSSVPGGTEKGKPTFDGESAFDVFTIASLIAFGLSVTALVMFLAVLSSPKQTQEFRRSLPLKLLLGLGSLFTSIASMLVSFGAAHFYVLKDDYRTPLFPFYAAICFPVTVYALLQLPLYVDLVRTIFRKTPRAEKISPHGFFS